MDFDAAFFLFVLPGLIILLALVLVLLPHRKLGE